MVGDGLPVGVLDLEGRERLHSSILHVIRHNLDRRPYDDPEMSNAPADPLSFVPRDLPTGTTCARARLRLGIASVGTLVVLSAGLLVLGVPDDVLPDSTSWALTDVAWLVLPESASRGSMDKTWTKKGELY